MCGVLWSVDDSSDVLLCLMCLMIGNFAVFACLCLFASQGSRVGWCREH
jgi:hypothetical protein